MVTAIARLEMLTRVEGAFRAGGPVWVSHDAKSDDGSGDEGCGREFCLEPRGHNFLCVSFFPVLDSGVWWASSSNAQGGISSSVRAGQTGYDRYGLATMYLLLLLFFSFFFFSSDGQRLPDTPFSKYLVTFREPLPACELCLESSTTGFDGERGERNNTILTNVLVITPFFFPFFLGVT